MTLRTSIERLADTAPIAHTARAAAGAALQAQAGRTIRAVIKARARAYALRPRELDAIAQGLFACTPRDLILGLNAINAVSTMRGLRWVGFGGEVPVINLKSAMLYARFSRAKAHQIAAKAHEAAA